MTVVDRVVEDRARVRPHGRCVLAFWRGSLRRPIRAEPRAEQQKDLTILDVFRNAVVVKTVARDWVDYLIGREVGGRAVIVNVLWEMKEGR